MNFGIAALADAASLEVFGVKLAVGSWAEWASGIASTLAVIVALLGYWLASRTEAARVRRRRVEVAQQIGFKLWRVGNCNEMLGQVLNATPPDNISEEDKLDLWRWIKPGLNETFDPSLLLSAEETNLLIEINEMEFLVDFSLMVDRYSTLLRVMEEWRRDYMKLNESLAPAAVEGDRISHELARPEYLRVLRTGMHLNGVIRFTIEVWQENRAGVRSLMSRFNPTMKRHLKLGKFMDLSMPE